MNMCKSSTNTWNYYPEQPVLINLCRKTSSLETTH